MENTQWNAPSEITIPTIRSTAQPSVTSKPQMPLKSVPPGPPKKRAKTQALKEEVMDREMGNRLRSEAWNHFTIVKGTNPIMATCNYCGKNYAGNPSKNGTSHFFTHLNNQCTQVPWKSCKWQTKMTYYQTVSDKSNKPKVLDVNDLRNSLARMVIIDELPFNVVEGEGFRQYSIKLEPKFTVPSRVTVARYCMKLYKVERRKLKKALKGRRLCLTIDTWTSLQNLNYMVLTAHYINDDWALKKIILNFCIIQSHKGAMIVAKLDDCLHGWGIDKILTLTIDNASSNDLCVQEFLKDFKFKDVLLDNNFFHVRCAAHILNLVVKDGLKEHYSSIVRVRNACKYIKSSPARQKLFRQCVEKEKIGLTHMVILDVDTRWNSTYMMLDRAGKYDRAFDRLQKSDKSFQDFFDCYEIVNEAKNVLVKKKGKEKDKKMIGPPKKEDLVVARHFVTFLKLFYDVTIKFFSTSHVTSNICVPELCKVKQNIESKMGMRSDSDMFSMAMGMSSKYDKYWSNWSNINHLLFVAIVFDPRLKMRGVDVCLKKMYSNDIDTTGAETGNHLNGIDIKKSDIERHLNDLFMSYSMESSLNDMEPSSYPRKSENLMESEDIFSIIARESGEEDNIDTRNELGTYLSDGFERGDSLDVLGWWKSNSSKYPTLSNIARDILAIPVSTVASEQAFSTSGRVISPFRSSLDPKTVEALVCEQNWIRGTGTAVDIFELVDEFEQYENIAEESSSSCLTTDEAFELDSE